MAEISLVGGYDLLTVSHLSNALIKEVLLINQSIIQIAYIFFFKNILFKNLKEYMTVIIHSWAKLKEQVMDDI